MATETSIEHRKPSTALSPADERRLHRSGLIAAHLMKLALMMGEPMDKDGARLRLMAEDLADLPADSVRHAITAWRRGDTRHLSSYLQDHTRIGVFFPKPAELREIAGFYLREKRQRESDRERIEQDERDALHRKEHPDEYVHMGDIVKELYLKQGQREASTLPPNDDQYTNPQDKILAALSRSMYAGIQLEPAVAAQVLAWRGERTATGAIVYQEYRLMDLQIGDRVHLATCAGPAGSVTGLNRSKVLVCFDDQPCVTWVLRPSSLQRVDAKDA